VRLCAVTAALSSSVVPAAAMVGGGNGFEFDFHGDLYNAGRAITSGANPYEMKSLEVEAAVVRAGGILKPYASPRWPAPALLTGVPFSLLPFPVAASAFLVLSAAALIVGLRLLGVRDWRCIAVASLSWPALWGDWVGNVSSLLVLGLALAWRWRTSLLKMSAALASVIGAKLFMWPVLAWLLVTRRFRLLAVAGLIASAAMVGGWALLGFAGLLAYPHLLALVAYIGEGRGNSLVACLLSVGAPIAVARAIAVACAGLLMVMAARLTRLPDGDRRAFGLVVVAALTATPVVWSHYLVLLFLPIALLRPRLSAIWFVPLFAGVTPLPPGHPTLLGTLPDLALEVVVIGWLCSPLLQAPRTVVGLTRERAALKTA
jgi:hypothetical protein